MDPSPHKPFSEEARRHGFDPEWLLSYARQHLDAPPEDVNAAVDTDAVIKPLLDQLNRHPISAIWVANFKSFGPKPQRFPLAPVTLVFGPNSAGKSSLMQALLYAQHALLENELDVKHPRGAGTTVDLGGFQNILHRHAENGVLTFGFEFVHHWRRPGAESLPAIWWVEVGTRIHEDGFIRGGDNARVLRAWLETDGQRWAELSAFDLFLPNLSHIEHEIRIAEFMLGNGMEGDVALSPAAALKMFGEAPECFSGETRYSQRDLLDGIQSHLSDSSINWKAAEITFSGLVPQEYVYRGGFEESAFRYFLEENTASISKEILREELLLPLTSELRLRVAIVSKSIETALQSIGYLSSARILPGRDFENINFRDRNHPHNGGASWDALRSADGQAIRTRLNKWFADLAQRENRRGLAQYRFETSYDLNRNLVEEIIETEAQNYITGTLVTAYGQAEHDEDGATLHPSEILAHVDTADLVKAIREAIEAKDGATTNHRLQIVDARVGRPVTPADIGVGIQYLIPVLVEILGARDGTKIIEEPELHAHPALQAELGDTLIEGALRVEAPGRYIVETHSEHLILRILRRIREADVGSEAYPARLPKIRPEDVAVIYAEPSSEGTILHHLKISEDGDFIDRWPSGFFTERADELF